MDVVVAAAAIAAGVGAGAVCAAVNEAVRQSKARGNEPDRRVGMVERGVGPRQSNTATHALKARDMHIQVTNSHL